MLTIKHTQVSWAKRSDGMWDGCVFASDIGLKPGQWPESVMVEGKYVNKLFLDTTITHPKSTQVDEDARYDGRYYRSKCGKFNFLIAND